MDFEWQTQPPADVTSPFYQLSQRHEQRREALPPIKPTLILYLLLLTHITRRLRVAHQTKSSSTRHRRFSLRPLSESCNSFSEPLIHHTSKTLRPRAVLRNVRRRVIPGRQRRYRRHAGDNQNKHRNDCLQRRLPTQEASLWTLWRQFSSKYSRAR